MSSLFTLSTTLSSQALPATREPRLFYLLVEITANPQAPVRRAAVNLALVVDASKSMLIPALDDDLVEELARRGLLVETIADGVPAFRVMQMPPDLQARAQPVRNMDFAQQALRLLVERLGPEDRFSLTAFAAQARTLIRNRSGREKGAILAQLESLGKGELGDDTILTSGLQLALREAQAGHSENHLTRLLLLTDGFAADEQQAMQVARQSAASGFALTTVGLGTAFNEGFLIGLAESSGGNAHLVFHPDELTRVFAAEFEAVQRVIMRNVELRIALTPGVELRRIHRVQPVLGELHQSDLTDNSFTLRLGDLERDQTVAVLIEAIFPPRPPGVYRAAQAVATGAAPLGGERDLARRDVVLQTTFPGQPASPPEPRVMKLVETVNTFRLQTRALVDAAAGDTAAATRKLQTAVTRLLADGNQELAATVQAEIAHLAQEGQLSAAGTKQLRYETRRLTQKLADE
jgi:hypothetical protein